VPPVVPWEASIPSLKRSLLALGAVAVVAAVSIVLLATRDDSPSGDAPPATSAAPAPTAPAPDPAETAAARSPSGVKPPAGDLPGWRQVFVDDFTEDVESWGDCGSYEDHTCPDLPEPYRSKWWAYPSSYQDTREKLEGEGGYYQPSDLSMSDGMLRIRLSREDGTTRSAAPYPRMDALTYGRYAVRFKVDDPAPGFKIAWLLWRTTDEWAEIDFPEADLDAEIHAFMHKEDGSQDNFATDVPVAGSGWHTSVIEWTPGEVRFLLDGELVGTSTESVPDTPMNWIIQSETTLTGEVPEDGAEAAIDIDWVAAWERA
jgi:Glycosyl hydrolases family 16